MSVSKLLIPNIFNIQDNSVTINGNTSNPTGQDNTLWSNDLFNPPRLIWGSDDISAPSKTYGIGFRASLAGGSALNSLTGYNVVGNFFVNYGPFASDSINYESSSFDLTTGVFTVPRTGLWHLCAGAFYNALVALSVDTNILIGIGDVGDTSSPYTLAMTFAQASSLQNFSIQCECDVFLQAGTQLQAFTQQDSGQTQVVPASRFNFFSGYLISNNTSSPV